jgi:CubicO group peptidase (beta-lactamase class C family)
MIAAPPPSPGPAPATIDALQRQLGALLADPAHPLLALDALALRGGRVVWAWRTGLRHVGGHGLPPLPVTAGTRWRVASITKLVVTLGVMRLVEDGRLALDDDVSALLGWPLRHPQFPHRAITLRLLLSHRSGLSDGDERYSFDGHTRLQQVLQAGGALYAGGANWRRDLAPGTGFEYVNLNFGLVAQVMERATGERFDLLMQRLVLQPLGLRAGFDPAAWPRHQQLDIATLYRKRGTDGEHAAWDPAGPWVPQADDFRLQPAAPPAGLDGHEVGSNGTLFGPQGRCGSRWPTWAWSCRCCWTTAATRAARSCSRRPWRCWRRSTGAATAARRRRAKTWAPVPGAWVCSASPTATTPPAATAWSTAAACRAGVTPATPSACAACSCWTRSAARAWCWCWPARAPTPRCTPTPGRR